MKSDKSQRIWGIAEASLDTSNLSSVRLKRCLKDLKSIRGKVLDLGCGGGMFTRAIKRERSDLRVYGVDIDPVAIKKGSKISKKTSLFCASVYRMPFKSNFFDALVSFDVFEHLEAPKMALDEARRVLKKGGLMHLYMPCEGDIYTIHGFFKLFRFIPKEKYAGHIQQYKVKKIQEMIKKSGFKIEKISYSSHYFMQAIDFFYYLILTVIKRYPKLTVEEYIISNKATPWSRLVNTSKKIISSISYFESELFQNIPSHGVHITCHKN